jgi:ankyrin repeat protein
LIRLAQQNNIEITIKYDELMHEGITYRNPLIFKLVRKLEQGTPIKFVETDQEQKRQFLYHLRFKMKKHLLLQIEQNPELVALTNIDDENDTILHYCAYDSRGIIEWILRAGADPMKYNAVGYKPIHTSISFGFTEGVRAILEAGEHPDTPTLDDDMFTPLTMAVTNSANLVYLLLDKGADPNLARGDGMKPLHIAAKVGSKRIIESLLLAGANLNEYIHGYTPLHYAIQRNSLESVIALLRANADTNLVTPQNQTALEYAIACNVHPNIIKVRLCYFC